MKTIAEVRRTYVFLMDITVAVIAFLSTGLFKIENVLVITYVLLIPYLKLTKRKNFIFYFIIASGISTIWMIISRNQYVNNSYYLVALGINLYPLLAWALGLMGSYSIYFYYDSKLRSRMFIKKLLLYLAVYWPSLILFETVGYHVFYIRNTATAGYPGLPVCECIHAPVWMQISYFAMGPVFFIVAYVIYKFQDDLRDILQRILAFQKGGV